MSKPELGKVAVGDQLLVIPAAYGRTRSEPVEAVVTKAARVWIDLRDIYDVRSQARAWRMRLDTQNVGSQYSQQDRFVTADQYAWEQRNTAANAYLREIDLIPGYKSPWYSEDRRLDLANLLRQHEGLPEL